MGGSEGVTSDEGRSDESEEGRIPKVRRAPTEPTVEERRINEITHLQFRSWCTRCVQAKVDSNPHFKRSEEAKKEKSHPIVRGTIVL